MNSFNLAIFFILSILCGAILEIIFEKLHFLLTKSHYKIHHFTLGKYFFLLLFPGIAILFIGKVYDWAILNVFLIFALLGTFLEFLVGWFYQKIEGQRLWTYHKYSISKFTSYLSIPLWGFCGVAFWLIAKALT